MTPEDKKRMIQREATALERMDSGTDTTARIARLKRLADLYYSVDQFQEAREKYHDFRTLAVGRNLLGSAEVLETCIRESWCLYERGDLAGAEKHLLETEKQIRSLPAEEKEPLLAELHTLYGYIEIRKGRYDEALNHCQTGFLILQQSRDDQALAKLQICYGHVYFRTGELDRAREYYEDGLASARRASDVTRQIQATINLAIVCKEQSDNDRALYLLDKVRETLKDSVNYSYRGHVLLNMAVIYFHRGDLQLAEESYKDALSVYMQSGQQQCAVMSRIGLARIQMLRGRLTEARGLLRSTLEISKKCGYLREEILIRRDLGDVDRSMNNPEKALRTYEEALAVADPLGGISEHSVQIGRRIGIAHLRLGNVEEARTHLSHALLGARRIGERYEEAILSCALGRLAVLENRIDDFEKMFGIGIDMLRKMGEKISLGKALIRHARLGMENAHGEDADFQLELAEARRIFIESGVPLWLGKARLEEARFLARSGVSSKCEQALAEADMIFKEQADTVGIDQVDLLRRTLEEKIVDHSVSRGNDHLAIHDLLPASSEDFDLDSLLEDLVARTDGDRGILMIFDDAEGTPLERSLFGFQLEQAGDVIRTLHPVIDRCRRGGRPFLSTAVATDPRIPGVNLSDHGSTRSLLLVPFRTSGEISGAIYLERGERRTPYGSRALDMVVGLVRSHRFALSLLSTRQKELIEENRRLRRQVNHSDQFDQIVTQSRRMDDVLDLVRKVAGANVTVLIQGETGTGKQLIAQAVHSGSPRREKPLFCINCATLPEQLLESELFGHERGAFTGAHADKEGLLAEASGSTVFLDEIDKMNQQVQSKLLHVLEEKRIRPVGSNRTVDVDVRFICASNRNLTKEVREGRFLEDLYYRLNVISIDLPPLRERPEDVLLLSRYFLRIFSAEMGKDPISLDEAVSQVLVQHTWPGNVRELRSEMRRLIVLNEGGVVTMDNLSPAIRGASGEASHILPGAPEGGSLKEQVQRYEKGLLRRYLEENAGNVSKTSRVLGISRWGLHKKLDKHGLNR